MLRDKEIAGMWDVYVVFISNANQSVALWSQKAARARGNAVIWDYHVILLLRPRQQDDGSLASRPGKLRSWVYDFDTTLPIPCPWEDYLDSTFFRGITPEYESQFRVVPGPPFLENFASDRSHMVVHPEGNIQAKDSETAEGVMEEPIYYHPPPDYPAICGAGALKSGMKNNLMSHFVSMSVKSDEAACNTSWGKVLDRNGVNTFFENE
ncbi:unnamed protein product [Cyclocybe aegerita]|uniref:Protein N-terminal glutamine amidohydrolase n=1 Tax=Cyclocybe aegerita TaxID=1973307 RepID=A0A8S0W721_CYCAE|nr:unnamed protein product [Cyclocybe aegerita]